MTQLLPAGSNQGASIGGFQKSFFHMRRHLQGQMLLLEITWHLISQRLLKMTYVSICLLPNATHLLQPLDVAVFRGLKIEWRQILQKWRKESRMKGSIPKNHFPAMLAKLHARQKAENAISGFEPRAYTLWIRRVFLSACLRQTKIKEVKNWSKNLQCSNSQHAGKALLA